jgi:AcrR family transcriptional regulator
MIADVAGHAHAQGSRRRRTERRLRPSAPPERGSGQRERLLDAITRLAAREGYPTLTVAQVISLAGVSRPTFYEHFTDSEDALLAALAPIGDSLRAEVAAAARTVAPERCAAAVVEALVGFAGLHPGIARVAMSESLAGGQRLLDARDEMNAAIARVIEDAYVGAPGATLAPDLPSPILVGAATRMLGRRLADGEPVTRAVHEKLAAWLHSYERPLDEHRWRALHRISPRARPMFSRTRTLAVPPPAPGGRGEQVLQAQRLAIMFATVQEVTLHGYDGARVTAIITRAGVDARVFYRCFADKAAAVQACGEMLFGHLMAAAAGASVTGESWPERVWEAAAAFAEGVEENAPLARLALLDGHPAGAQTARRAQQAACAFTIFLEEGFRHEPRWGDPSDVAMEAIASSVFELGYRVARSGEGLHLSGVLGHLVFIALAPFLGAAEANRFLDNRVASLPASDRPKAPALAAVG